ncbi:MAG TPA: hypothetical protein VKW70_00240 [Terriglobia bacterium]|nr:hypothetical protein [Terriglobia bacterium]
MTSKAIPPDFAPHPARIADSLREGVAPLPIRRKGAQGELPVPFIEKVEILVILTQDPDEEVRAQALATLKACPAEQLRDALRDPSCLPAALEFAARHLIECREELLDALLENPALRPELQDLILSRMGSQSASVAAGSANDPEAQSPETAAGEAEAARARETTLQKIHRMSVAEKIKCALTGTPEERFILIRDSNKIVARAVLQSPKISESEVEAYASMKNVTEEVLRLLALNRAFMKSYSVLRALVNNPRAPLDVTLPLIHRLNERDMKSLAINKNVPDALRTTAAKTLTARQSARSVSPGRKH